MDSKLKDVYANASSSGGDVRSFADEGEQQMDQAVAKAVEAAARGENTEQILETLLAVFPGQARDALRKKFSAALAKRGIKASDTKADIMSRGTMARLRDMFALSARQAYDRIAALVRSRPDVAQRIEQAGKMLVMNGVVVERVEVGEDQLGQMAPTAGVGQAAVRGTAGRGT